MQIATNRDYRDKIFKCPFCLTKITKVGDIDGPFGNVIVGGSCECGAVFVNDRTGKNLGEAFSDALAFAYDWDYEKSVEVDPDEYVEVVIRFNGQAGKYLLGDGGRLDRSAKSLFIKRVDRDVPMDKED
jgi:hypothetical protein